MASGARTPKPPGFAHLGHQRPTLAEGEEGKLNAKFVAEFGVHGRPRWLGIKESADPKGAG